MAYKFIPLNLPESILQLSAVQIAAVSIPNANEFVMLQKAAWYLIFGQTHQSYLLWPKITPDMPFDNRNLFDFLPSNPIDKMDFLILYHI